MPASLHQVQICHRGSGGASTWRAGLRVRHLEDAISAHLPKGYVLGGKQKINLNLFPSTPEMTGADRVVDGMRYVDLGAIGSLSFGPFDIAKYKALTPAARDEMILSVLENALAALARDMRAEEAPIHEAARAIRAAAFTYECETKLSRSTKNRRVRVHIFVRFERTGLSWRAEVRRRDGELLEERWLIRKGSYFDIATDFRRSSLNSQTFELFDWNGTRRATVDLRKHAV